MANKQEIIAMLKADMRDEHQAIIQYLQHAYALGEGEFAGEIEAIARDEMRHLDWLAEAVVELGGDPTMERSPVDLSGAGPADWMGRDVIAEEGAIAQYSEQIAAIDDPALKRLLTRILWDEQDHRDKFVGLAAELAEEGVEATLGRAAEGQGDRTVEILQQGVQHEYTIILQYLYHNFVTPHCEIGRELEMQAINEMQHLGWLAEEVAGRGVLPHVEHATLDLSKDTADMLRADIAVEQAVAMDYGRQADEVDDEGVKKLLLRLRDHETYHDELFSDILEELEAKSEVPAEPEPKPPAGPSLTVGSLLGQEQK